MRQHPLMIPDSESKQIMSRAFLDQLAAVDNWACEEVNKDYFGIDAKIDFQGGISLQVQLKSTSEPDYLTDGRLAYSVDKASFEKWSHSRTPVIIVVEVLDKEQSKWLDHSVEGVTTINGIAYWKRVDTLPLPEKGSRTVHFDQNDRVDHTTIETWRNIMQDSFGIPEEGTYA
ncbi:DUF4365 domain-containing protein [Corynebacterium qintianiae]|uniref:DUF4365 domain-containing protein n=1 Tax=Corynebacterium qintianiae TaxID=2709392 RepID=UPI0013E9BF90|nr:DUF4365 domain-containing protein [Corynebacterium qintianiae]